MIGFIGRANLTAVGTVLDDGQHFRRVERVWPDLFAIFGNKYQKETKKEERKET